MINRVILLFLPVLFFSSFDPRVQHDTFRIVLSDSLQFDAEMRYDSMGLPDGYQADVLTPVCEADKCYAIELRLTWDLIGRYQSFDTIPGQPLTKLDHEPFVDSDYLKLDEILSNSKSVLASYKKEELVRDTRTSSIDGFTGATIREVKESVISGAVYSCYTLWHICNGAVVDSLQELTSSVFSDSLVQKMVSMSDQQVNYFIINAFSDDDFSDYLPAVLVSIKTGKGYFAKNAIEKMPSQVINMEQAQFFFAQEFDRFNYFTQVALLEKLDSSKLTDSLEAVITRHLDDRNSQKTELIRKLTQSQL